jgi:hypothetical protein
MQKPLIYRNRKTNIYEFLKKECKKRGKDVAFMDWIAVDVLEKIALKHKYIKEVK